MWKKRKYEEIRILEKEEYDRTRKYNLPLSLRRFVKTLLLVFIALCLFAVLIDPDPFAIGSGTIKRAPLSELPFYFGFYIIIAFVFAIYRFLQSFLNPGYFNRSRISNKICASCSRLMTENDNLRCNCGGVFENIKFYKWIEEDVVGIPTAEKWLFENKVMKNEA